MLNHLGRPDTSSFATYAYCAGLHLDNDESITHGWVIKRGKGVSGLLFNSLFTFIFTRFIVGNRTLSWEIIKLYWSLTSVHIGFGVLMLMHMEQQPTKRPCSIPKNGRPQHFLTKKTMLNGPVSIQSRQLLHMPHSKVSTESHSLPRSYRDGGGGTADRGKDVIEFGHVRGQYL